MPVILALGRLSWEGYEFKAGLGSRKSLFWKEERARHRKEVKKGGNKERREKGRKKKEAERGK